MDKEMDQFEASILIANTCPGEEAALQTLCTNGDIIKLMYVLSGYVKKKVQSGEHLNVFMVIGKPGSAAFDKPRESRISNLLILYAFIDSSKETHSFHTTLNNEAYT